MFWLKSVAKNMSLEIEARPVMADVIEARPVMDDVIEARPVMADVSSARCGGSDTLIS